ncbi:MAG: NADH:flavin oxidoreductase [Chlorobium sp.]|jgi:2,4-dienoyl-CoA reductase-like NADH-dependent reductase (Old Yellow Enzyme family)|nr:NADH:flavin oxidoreductase [Chlorobium sp.]
MRQDIFGSAVISGIRLQNRLIRSATHESMAESSGAPSATHEKLYTSLARGGVGAVITGYAGVQQDGRTNYPGMLMMHHDSLIPAYRKLADAVHRHGTPIILQLAHCGRQTRSAVTGMKTVAPSALKDRFFNEERPQALGEQEIEAIISNFVSAAGRAVSAGFDGVQLHMAHGYLLAEFLSGYTNRRKDRWGGSTENKFRIVAEILRRIHNEQGDFPVLAKINGFDQRPGGMRGEEAVDIARLLEASGCSAIEVSSGTIEEGLSIMRGPKLPVEPILACNFRFKSMPVPLKKVLAPLLPLVMPFPDLIRNYNLEVARAIKKAVSIPVIAVGGIHTMEDISAVFGSGAADFVAMSRPFIIEPDIVRKLREGSQTDSRCIACNYCAIMIEEGPLRCWYGKMPGMQAERRGCVGG